jgi:hypothetical protein
MKEAWTISRLFFATFPAEIRFFVISLHGKINLINDENNGQKTEDH